MRLADLTHPRGDAVPGEAGELRGRGAITPWNFPVLLAIWKTAPALVAGNTMVLKPSPYTPLCTLKLGEILRDGSRPASSTSSPAATTSASG